MVTSKEAKKYKFVGISAAVFGIIVIIAVCVYFFLFFGNEKHVMGTNSKLVVDHDGGADDAMAIFMALLYEKYFNGPSIVGLTTVNGNVGEDQVYINTQRILDIARRRDVPIWRGSPSALVVDEPKDVYFGIDGLGDLENISYTVTEAQPEHAAISLIEMSKKYEGNLTVLAIGPMTNIALAIKLDPKFIHRLDQLYVSAGSVTNEANPAPEFNAFMDVEAYDIVVKNAVPEKVTIIPFPSIINSLKGISRDWRQNIFGAIDTDIMKAQNDFERVSLPKKDAWHLMDPASMALVLNEDIVTETRFSDNGIHLCGNQRGLNTNNFTNVTTPTTNVNAIYSINQTLYQSFLLDLFSAELK